MERPAPGFSANPISTSFPKSTAVTSWVTLNSNHYKYMDYETSKKIEDDLCRILIEKGITPRILFLDETNWFNFIKKGEKLPQNVKKQTV